MNILVAKNGSQLGPFSEADIHAKLASGEFAPTDYGWKEGMASWEPLSQMFASAPSPAPAAPAPSAYTPQPYNAPQGQYNAPQGQYSAPGAQNSPYPAAYQPGAVQQWGAMPAAGGYAGFWLRAVAIIIDFIRLFIINFIVSFLFIAVLGQRAGGGIANLINIVTNWMYFAYLESSDKQATVGKMVMGLKVTDLNGNRIGFGQATGRYFGKIVSALILCIGFIMAGFTERKQALHDLMASTLVLKK